MAATGRLERTNRSTPRAPSGILVLLALVLLAVLIAWRVATESTPPLVLQRTVAGYVRLPGPTPVLAWPRAGQSAVEVEGVGSFGTSGASTPAPIASVAKVMTAYLTLLGSPLSAGKEGFAMTITSEDVSEQKQRLALGQSTVSVRAGERITERQALEALLLPSANNVAELLAAHHAGGVAAFVGAMNATSRKLGMNSTTYTDPSGFEDETVSTAADQLKLARVAMRVPAFAQIVDESSAELPVAGRVGNYDELVGSDGYVGVKTGSDRAAGGCFVFAKRIEVDGRSLTVLGVTLGQREGSLIDAALTSAKRLGDSVAASVRVETALPAGTTVLKASTSDGRSTTAMTARAVREIGWPGLALPIQLVMRSTSSRVRAGDPMATVTVRGARAAGTYARSTRAVGRSSLGWRLRHLL